MVRYNRHRQVNNNRMCGWETDEQMKGCGVKIDGWCEKRG